MTKTGHLVNCDVNFEKEPCFCKLQRKRSESWVVVRENKVLQDETIMLHMWVSHIAGDNFVPCEKKIKEKKIMC